jgi:hypothetical protein
VIAELFNKEDPSKSFQVPDNVCFMAYRGSVAHNMWVPGSDPNSIDDVDLIGVVLAPVECYLGLQQWGSTGTKEVKQNQYDAVFYEIKKAVSLLLQGNPNILSLLWTHPQHIIYRSEVSELLINNRNLFVGKHVYNSFAGYAHAQLEKMESRDPAQLRDYIAVTNELKYRGAHPNHKGEQFPRENALPFPDSIHIAIDSGDFECMEDANRRAMSGVEYNAYCTSTDVLLQKLASYHKKGENLGYMGDKRKRLVLEHGYDAKNAGHLIRLLRMCIEFLQTGELQVYRTDAEELLDIKRGKWELSWVKEHAAELFVQAKEARDKSTLPSEPDREGAEKMLVQILRKHVVE